MRRETWLQELAVELAARGVARGAAAEIVVEADGHLRETAAAPLETFGSPATYATALVDALAPTVLRTQEGGLIDQLRPAEHFVLFGRGRGLSRAQAVQDGRRLAEQLGWDALRAPVAGKLSGGTRQKLNVVLAALGDPDVLLLDEPYQGLDRDSVQRFWELLWAWRDEGGCALVVSHAHDAVDRADAVVEL